MSIYPTNRNTMKPSHRRGDFFWPEFWPEAGLPVRLLERLAPAGHAGGKEGSVMVQSLAGGRISNFSGNCWAATLTGSWRERTWEH